MTAPIRNAYSEKIVICESCRGTGLIQRRELEDYHRNEYRTWTEPCPICEGHGRVLEKTGIGYFRLTPESLRWMTK